MQVSTLTFLITVIGTGAGVVATMSGFGAFFIRRLDNQTRELRSEIEGVRTELGTRLDNQVRELRSEIQCVRTGLDARLDNQTRDLRGEIEGVRTDLGARLENQTRDLRGEIEGVRSDLGGRMDRRFAQVDTRLDRVLVAVSLPAPDTAAGSPGDA